MELTFRDKFALRFQRLAGQITFPSWGALIFFALRFVGRYRVQKIRVIRRRYQRMLKQTTGPIIVCANHLTKIDSAIITCSLASFWSYTKSFKGFSWNLPERARYTRNIFLRIICYLGSCVPIDRGGNRNAVKKSLDKLIYLLRRGEPVAIFPEGKRSCDGKVDTQDFSYGVGKLINSVKNCRVLCIYMRGDKQKRDSAFPKIGEKIYFSMKMIKPYSTHEGLRATRDFARQVIQQLKMMEHTYFALYRQ